jgi:eukaryotic-like serine/threonine-protein kinase
MLGRSLGNYGVVSKIGEGGMGVVYLARHVTLGRRAAIKVLRPALSSNQDIVSRFFNEARAVTAVRHPGIVEVFDFGFLEDRTAYIIMEYLEGESLAARLRRGRSTITVTLTIVRAIARALQAAHEQGIVHRDLKPDNVFLVPDSELPSGERVKLLDFGIAKLAFGDGNASHTTTGTVMGTPTYMSPEQCRGAGSVDHRADLYSLGCVAYEMLCGQPPFVADGPGDVIARHLYFEPALLRSHRPDIPPEIEELVLRLLKKEPRARYSAAKDLVRAVDDLAVVTTPVAARNEQTMSDSVATLPMVRDTTLNAAASSSVKPRNETSGPRRGIIAAVATVAVALLVVIILLFTRGAQDVEPSPNAAPAALATEQRGPERATLPAAPAPGDRAPSSAAVSPTAVSPTVPGPTAVSPTAVSPTASSPAAPSPTAPSSTAPSAGAPVSSESRQPSPPEPHRWISEEGTVTPSDPGGRTNDSPSPPDKPRTHTHRSATTKLADGAKPTETAATDPAVACTVAAFATVLDAKSPGSAAIDDAWTRLNKCKPTMKPELYSDIQRRLIAKS